MNGINTSVALWPLVAVSLFGLASAWTARLSEGSSFQVVAQFVFFQICS